MAKSSAMNSDSSTEEKTNTKAENKIVKTEMDVVIKLEELECLVCCSRSRNCFDIYGNNTTSSGSSLYNFISKYTHVDIIFSDCCSKFVCKSCYDLINILEQAELEYMKLKETFETIISKNPLFEPTAVTQQSELTNVKDEISISRVEEDSEDEPLSKQSKIRNSKANKKKKKPATSKIKENKSVDKNSWECDECDSTGESGGPGALTTHKLAKHTLVEAATIKTEDGSQSPFNNDIHESLEINFDDFDDDDDDSNFNPDEFKKVHNQEKKKTKKKKSTKGLTPTKRPKVMHQCDQCNARYSSLVRLASHKQKHDGAKPPYICEVCGARYKHKRACDIHIALHKGISDWKCEECNKLFPSKNALARHNNIHTGKLNYQCDLCGKSFIHTSSFKMHKLSHSGVKPHACDVCGLALMTRSHLKRHKRIHSGEKRHECAVCGKRFSERYNLAAHQRAHAGAALPPAAPRPRLFRCAFCGERFERRAALERHAAADHGRTLERPPATPRNTMSKLLKQRAQPPPPPTRTYYAQCAGAAPATPRNTMSKLLKQRAQPPPPPTPDGAGKEEPRAAPSKLLAQLTTAAGSWSGVYAAEFGLRNDFPH